ncbi:hypothetical protein BJX61DRAFT_519647 [Aspergillus egyptiacus]|nr:hypothetical protein BJX61DRAFT_519647 [Aspergillus egyptiacus]
MTILWPPPDGWHSYDVDDVYYDSDMGLCHPCLFNQEGDRDREANILMSKFWAAGYMIIALLEEGADPTMAFDDETILTLWSTLAFRWVQPEIFDQVLHAIAANMPNINARLGHSEATSFLHSLLFSELSEFSKCDARHLRLVLNKLLAAELRHPLNVDCLDGEGKTTLLKLLSSLWTFHELEDEEWRKAQVLVDLGSRIDFVSAKGESVLTDFLRCYKTRELSDRTMAHRLERLIRLDPSATHGHSVLIDLIPASVLQYMLYRGRTMTSAVLLRYGMKRQLNQALEGPSWLTNIVDEHDNYHDMAAIFNELAKPVLFSDRISKDINKRSPAASIFDLAFCGQGRTLAFAGSYRFKLNSRHDDPGDLVSLSSSERGRNTILDPESTRRSEIKARRPRWRRAHSCPGTEKQWLGMATIIPLTTDYSSYSKQEPQTVWRRNSLPELQAGPAALV